MSILAVSRLGATGHKAESVQWIFGGRLRVSQEKESWGQGPLCTDLLVRHLDKDRVKNFKVCLTSVGQNAQFQK